MRRSHTNLPASKETCKKAGEVFIGNCSGRTRRNGYKLKKGKSRLDIMKEFFTVRVVKHRLSSKVEDAPVLTVFKARLGWGLNNPTWLVWSVPIRAEGLGANRC